VTETITRRRVLDVADADRLVGTLVPHGVDAELVHDPAVIVDEAAGEPVIAYLPMAPADAAALTEAVLKVEGWTSQARAGRLRNQAVAFGMTPRRPTFQRDSCKITAMARDQPEVHAVIAGYAVTLGAMLEAVAPGIVARDRMTIAEIEADWRMAPDAAWTSGVINRTSQLPYHRDSMNFDAWVAMPVLRDGVSGGYLHIPEYGLALSCRHGHVVIFNGFRLVHGVTPLTAVRPARAGRPGGYRYSVVYYALRGMKDCATFADELARGRAKRTEREAHQHAFVTGAIPDWR
jgi:hypothetical protein